MYYLGNGVAINSKRVLVHYNHNHDALGRFAKSATATISSKKTLSKPKDYKKRLNKLDKVSTDALGKAAKAAYKGQHTKAKGYQKISKQAAAKKKQVGREAVKKHYTVKMRDVYRNTERKRDAVVYASLIAVSPVRPIIPALGYYAVSRSKASKIEAKTGINPRAVPGKKYYVYNQKK